MSKSKLLAAGVVRDFRFCSKDDFDLYLYALDHWKCSYSVIDTYFCDDGTVLARIVQRYNSADLIQL